MMENSVVLPAPFGPISAVIRPTSTASETGATASSPPKRLHTCWRQSNGLAMGALWGRCPQPRKAQAEAGQQSRNPMRRKRHDEAKDATVDAKIGGRMEPGDA